MTQTPDPQNDENEKPAPQSSRGSKLAAAGMLGLYVSGAAFLWQQEAVIGFVQAASVEAVHDFATAAGVVAQSHCPVPGVAAQTYDNISKLYDNRVIFSFSPFTAGGLAPVLEELNNHKIAVQAAMPSHVMGLDTDAVFEKGAQGSEGVLTLGDTARFNELTKEFLRTLPERAATLKPGEKLVLHDTFAARSSDEGKYQIVKVEAGATDYRIAQGRNPFPAGKPYPLPVNKCAP